MMEGAGAERPFTCGGVRLPFEGAMIDYQLA